MRDRHKGKRRGESSSATRGIDDGKKGAEPQQREIRIKGRVGDEGKGGYTSAMAER